MCSGPDLDFIVFEQKHMITKKMESTSAHKIGVIEGFSFPGDRSLTRSQGSLLFCPNCGTLLDLPRDGEDVVTCDQCEHVEPATCKLAMNRREGSDLPNR